MPRPWREIAVPHEDVLKGSFQQSEFAADISQVHQGRATPEYQDPVRFFTRTYITEGMRLLLDSVIQRLAGRAGDPVIQLQTAFGGGKTHTLLAVFHLARGQAPVSELHGVAPILDEAGVTELPPARVAIIDGINLSPSQPKRHDGIEARTLWGELAWQLGGASGYERFRSADESGTAPGKDSIIALLEQAAPCVILMDELVAFYRQFAPGRDYPAGSFETNMSFVQALTEALKSVPRTILLASLPDSHNAGEGRGQVVLGELEGYFRRLHKIWKPVTKDEAFTIVRRRLFEDIPDHAAMDAACQAFADYYGQHGDQLPAETQEARYAERLRQAYPIHPEIFDRLYEDWSTLQNFQRTRGVLQLLAQVVHRLWNDGNADLMILPGALPLYDPAVRNKCLDYLPQGWDPVIDQDIDGPHSRPAEIDRQPLFGKIQAARRLARTIFLGSAPGAGARMVKGIEHGHILLGAAQPGQTLGHYQDALKRLLDKLNYINVERDRYWFDITPNLRREMESRKPRFHERDDVLPLLRDRLERLFARSPVLSGIHVFAPSADVPDDFGSGPRLVVLEPGSAYSRGVANRAFEAAEAILRTRGEQPRQKQNRLLFLAADHDNVLRLKDLARSTLAWRSIVDDIDQERLVLDTLQVKQARQQKDDAEQTLRRALRDTYRWLLNPSQELRKGRPETALHWETVALSASAPSLSEEIQRQLRDSEWLITEWNPIHLANLLKQWYFRDGTTKVGALRVWEDCCNYLYFPRVVNAEVFQRTVQDGLASEDFFGYASGRDGDKYLGFCLGQSRWPSLDQEALLIEREAASAYRQRIAPPPATPASSTASASATATAGSGTREPPPPSPGAPTPAPERTPPTRFYGTVELNPVKAKFDFARIVDEVIQPFTARVGIEVTIAVEIQARTAEGFDEALRRAVRENCRVLKFTNSEFEEE